MLSTGICARAEKARQRREAEAGQRRDASRALAEVQPRSAMAAEAPKEEPEESYFLEVSLLLGLESVQEFFELAPDVRELVEAQTELSLILAAGTATRTELLHIWRLPSADSLRRGMIDLAENAKYGRLDQLITSERQDLLTPIGARPTLTPADGSTRYLRVSGHLITKHLAEYQALYEAYPGLLKRYGLHYWGAFLNVSGRLNRVVSIWSLGPKFHPDSLKFLPGLDLLRDVEVEQFNATPYDQNGSRSNAYE